MLIFQGFGTLAISLVKFPTVLTLHTILSTTSKRDCHVGPNALYKVSQTTDFTDLAYNNQYQTHDKQARGMNHSK
jgi:hypothetical protein